MQIAKLQRNQLSLQRKSATKAPVARCSQCLTIKGDIGAVSISNNAVNLQQASGVPQLSRKVLAQASPSSTSSTDSHAGHAFLHDFCMTIPYGAIAILGGLVCFFAGAALKSVGGPLVGVGAATLLLSVLSLKRWKQGASSTPFTLLSAGAAGGAAYLCFPLVSGGVTGWVAGALTAVSAAAALFCLYNIIAGGNPPPRAHKEAGTA